MKLFKIGEKINKQTDLIISLFGVLIIFSCWYLITGKDSSLTLMLPNPIDVILSYKILYSELNLMENLFFSIKLNFTGYIYAILIAIPFGFFIGLFPVNKSLFSKYFNAIRYLPLPACSGIFMVIFGVGFGMKSWFLAFGVLIYIVPAIITHINELENPSNDKDYVYLQTIKTLGANGWAKFRYVYFPYVIEKTWVDIMNLTPISWTYITIVEILNKTGGIGALITTLSRQSRTPEVFALIFLIVIIGIVQDLLFKGLDVLFFPHKHNKKPIKNFFIK